MCLRAVGWLINQHVMGIHRHYGIEIVVFLIIIIIAESTTNSISIIINKKTNNNHGHHHREPSLELNACRTTYHEYNLKQSRHRHHCPPLSLSLYCICCGYAPLYQCWAPTLFIWDDPTSISETPKHGVHGTSKEDPLSCFTLVEIV